MESPVNCWTAFLKTGSPVDYLNYRMALQQQSTEQRREENAPEYRRDRPARGGVQRRG